MVMKSTEESVVATAKDIYVDTTECKNYYGLYTVRKCPVKVLREELGQNPNAEEIVKKVIETYHAAYDDLLSNDALVAYREHRDILLDDSTPRSEILPKERCSTMYFHLLLIYLQYSSIMLTRLIGSWLTMGSDLDASKEAFLDKFHRLEIYRTATALMGHIQEASDLEKATISQLKLKKVSK